MESIRVMINGSHVLRGLWHDDGTIAVTHRLSRRWNGREHEWDEIGEYKPDADPHPDKIVLLGYVHLDQPEMSTDQIAWLHERVIDYFAGLYEPRMRNYQQHTCAAGLPWTLTDKINLGGSCQRYMDGDWLAEAARRKGGRIYLTRPERTPDDSAARIAREEQSLELACEEGIIPGAMPADI